MNPEPKDALDREIDEVLASFAALQPSRVDAASVRQAMGARRAPRIPVWFAAAAVLVVAFGVWINGRSMGPSVPASRARSAAETRPAPMNIRPSPLPEGRETASFVSRPSSKAKPFAIREGTEPLYEGLPRIVIATIETPEALTTLPLAADGLLIPPIEIPALSVPTLSHETEKPQEKPQS